MGLGKGEGHSRYREYVTVCVLHIVLENMIYKYVFNICTYLIS